MLACHFVRLLDLHLDWLAQSKAIGLDRGADLLLVDHIERACLFVAGVFSELLLRLENLEIALQFAYLGL